jgi:hypothetical protein
MHYFSLFFSKKEGKRASRSRKTQLRERKIERFNLTRDDYPNNNIIVYDHRWGMRRETEMCLKEL